MKTLLFKSFFFLIALCSVFQTLAQDKLCVNFKDGSKRSFHLNNIVSIYTSKYDSDSIFHKDYQYQHIKTLQGVYVYDINDIDSISFDKYYEDKVSQYIMNVSKVITPFFLENENQDDVTVLIELLKAVEGVEDAWSDNHSLFVKLKNWETITYHIGHDESYDITFPEINDNYVNSFTTEAQRAGAIKPPTSPLNVVIANMEHFDESRQSQVDNCVRLKELFETCNIYPKYEPQPTIDFFKNDIYDYHVIYLLCHGTYDGKHHAFLTADEIGIDDGTNTLWNYTDCLNKLIKIRKKIPGATEDHIIMSNETETRNGKKCIVYRVAVTELFFEELVKRDFQNPNSVLFTCACQSLQDGYELAEALYAKKLCTYLGYTDKNSVGDEAGIEFYISMLKGESLGVSFKNLPWTYRSEKLNENQYSQLVLVPNKDYEGDRMTLFLAKTITDSPDINKITLEYQTHKTVTISGFATILLPNKLGFELSTNENMNDCVTISNIQYENSSFNGNYKFMATLSSELKTGETFYYRAFSFDGTNYNYGEIRSFTLEIVNSLTLSQNSLSLSAGNSTTVEITSGNGGYTVSVDEPTIATATLSGTTITIKGEAKGTAKVTVKDKSGQTAEINVNVESDYPGEDTRSLAFDYELEGTRYALYWQSEQNDVRYNADHTPYYRTKFTLDVTNNGTTKTYMVGENVYFTEEGGGQTPCMAIDLKSKKIFIFVNSSNGYSYSLDGYCFVSPLNNINFQKETVFTEANFGWWPYFTYNNGILYLQHFSFAGYYAMTSTRSSNGTWTTDWGYQIYPDEFKTLSEQAGKVLIIRGNS